MKIADAMATESVAMRHFMAYFSKIHRNRLPRAIYANGCIGDFQQELWPFSRKNFFYPSLWWIVGRNTLRFI